MGEKQSSFAEKHLDKSEGYMFRPKPTNCIINFPDNDRLFEEGHDCVDFNAVDFENKKEDNAKTGPQGKLFEGVPKIQKDDAGNGRSSKDNGSESKKKKNEKEKKSESKKGTITPQWHPNFSAIDTGEEGKIIDSLANQGYIFGDGAQEGDKSEEGEGNK